MRVVVIDDLVATGGTLMATCDLLAEMGVEVVECACLVSLDFLQGFAKVQEKYPSVQCWSLISEEILTVSGEEIMRERGLLEEEPAAEEEA